ncbi:hypothetical protein NKG94_00645 [Micromonospora sp. M12]
MTQTPNRAGWGSPRCWKTTSKTCTRTPAGTCPPSWTAPSRRSTRRCWPGSATDARNSSADAASAIYSPVAAGSTTKPTSRRCWPCGQDRRRRPRPSHEGRRSHAGPRHLHGQGWQ